MEFYLFYMDLKKSKIWAVKDGVEEESHADFRIWALIIIMVAHILLSVRC